MEPVETMSRDELTKLDQLLARFHIMRSYDPQSYQSTRLDVMEQVEGAIRAVVESDGQG